MGLVAIASAKGSPGVTTTALLLGALWPRSCVVAECDPSGGDVAWRMPDPHGRPLDPQAGLLGLVAAGRRSMHPDLVLQHSQAIVGGLDVVVGVTTPEQAASVRWADLAAMFASVPGLDVVADLGRIGAHTPQSALLDDAGVIVMLVDTVPSNVVHLRERLIRMRSTGATAPVHVVVVAPPRRERAVREVRDVLSRSEARFESVHHLAHDDAGAAFFLGQVRGRADRTALVRSARPLAAELAARTTAAFSGEDVLAGEPPVEPAAESVAAPTPDSTYDAARESSS